MNKKAISISLLLLALSSLVLSSVSITYFIVRDKDAHDVFVASNQIGDFYRAEAVFNHHLDNLFAKAVDDFDFSQGKQGFIDNYRKEMEEYQDDGKYLFRELKSGQRMVVGDAVDGSYGYSKSRGLNDQLRDREAEYVKSIRYYVTRSLVGVREQLLRDVNEDNIYLDEEKLVLTLHLGAIKGFEYGEVTENFDSGEDWFFLEYNYVREFEKVFK